MSDESEQLQQTLNTANEYVARNLRQLCKAVHAVNQGGVIGPNDPLFAVAEMVRPLCVGRLRLNASPIKLAETLVERMAVQLVAEAGE